MRASATVVAEPGSDRSERPRFGELRSSPPLTLRWARDCLYIVGSAFAPLGGDHLELEVVVTAGASLTIRSVAASVAQPGLHGAPSRFAVRARVEEDGWLHWRPEPGIAAAGCDHSNEVQLELASGSGVLWRDEVVLGRHGETGGRWRSTLTATLEGEPLLDQETNIGGPHWESPAVAAGTRAAGSLLMVGPDAPTEPSVRSERATTRSGIGRAAVMPLARKGSALTTALAPDTRTLRSLLDGPAASPLSSTGT